MSINRIKVIKLQKFNNPIGDTMKYLSKKSSFFREFGEVYFSEIKKNKIKGWIYHKKYLRSFQTDQAFSHIVNNCLLRH